MVGTHVLRDLKLCAQERRTYFSDQLLGGISLIAEALAEFAVKSVFRAAPVRQLMDERRVIAFAAGQAGKRANCAAPPS